MAINHITVDKNDAINLRKAIDRLIPYAETTDDWDYISHLEDRLVQVIQDNSQFRTAA